MFQFKDKIAQAEFQKLTTDTNDFTDCFKNDFDFEVQAANWRKMLNNYFHKAFKKVRVTNKPIKKGSEVLELIEKRKVLKKKDKLSEADEEEIVRLEALVAEKCQDTNRQKVVDNFCDLGGNDGNLQHQGIWKIKRKVFPKIKPSLPVGKKNIKNQLITNPEELKKLYLDTFKYRLRHRPVQPGFESLLDDLEELFKERLDMSKNVKTKDWTMEDLDEALKQLKSGKCRDPDGLIRELFKEGVIGEDLKKSMLILFNKIKRTRIFPSFMRKINISAIYKGRGEVTDLESDRGIFLVSLFRTILMKMIYKDYYPVIDGSMSDSNIGARKNKNIRNHIFIVNSIIHDVLSKKGKKPIDIMILDYKQMFDSECLYECMNDVYEAGLKDDTFALLYEANRINEVAVQTPNGLSKREVFKEIVMQGDVLAPLISSLQVDTMGKECLEEGKHLYLYKDKVPISALGMVDDLLTISECGYKTTLMNKFINSKTAMKKLQFGPSKCIKMHIGKSCIETLCRELDVGAWKIKVETDMKTGEASRQEYFSGQEKMKQKEEQMYLGDLLSDNGSHSKNVLNRKNKGLGVTNSIMQILNSTPYGKHYYEVALILRKSLFMSSLLLNSEAWVNISEKDIRKLEQADEILLSKILDCEANTNNVFKYLELGVKPLRFELMKRKILFLQYILQQEKQSMIYKVFEATLEDPIKNDFVSVCKKYLEDLKINLSFEEIKNLSKWKLKKIVNEKIESAAFQYLIKLKNSPSRDGRISKVGNIQYEKLEMQQYLYENTNTNISKFITKARAKTLEIKTHKSWKYDDRECSGCKIREESGDEILTCESFGKYEENEEIPSYSWFFRNKTSDMIYCAKVMMDRMKARKRLLENG